MLIELFALDGLEQIGPIVGYSEVEITERDLNVGTWDIRVPITPGNESTLHNWRAATYPGFEAVDANSGWRFGGYVTEQKMTQTALGTTIGMGGVDFQAELQNRLHWPDPFDHSSMWQPQTITTRPLTTAMHNLVAFHAGKLALEGRRIPDLVGEQSQDPEAGPDITAVADGKPLLEVMASWAVDSDYTARLEMWRTPYQGTVLYFYTPFRYQANMILSTATGSIDSFEVTELASPAETLIGTGGPIDGIEPEARPAQLNPRNYLTRDWRYRYSEAYRDFPSAGVNELFTEMLGWKAETAAKVAYKVGGAQLKNFGSLSSGDIGIGWRVPVLVDTPGQDTELVLPVTSSTVSFEAETGWKRTATLGDDIRTGQARVMQMLIDTTRRVRRLEGNG